MTMDTEIYKLESLVAHAPMPVGASLGSGFEGIERIDLFYFPRIVLTPVITFAHLAGTALSNWLNECRIVIPACAHPVEGGESQTIENALYVHGRSEVMKGRHTVSSVLLAKPHYTQDVPAHVWLTYLPEIYKRFLQLERTAT